MIALTLCNFRIDEYMENTVASVDLSALEAASRVVSETCQRLGLEQRRKRAHEDTRIINGIQHTRTEEYDSKTISTLDYSLSTMENYVKAMLYHPEIKLASKHGRKTL